MAVTIDASTDLAPFIPEMDEDKAAILIADALALAARIAPCLSSEDLDEDLADAAKATLRGAILRWYDAGSGTTTQIQAGPYQVQNSSSSRRNQFFPNEIRELSRLCGGGTRRAYMTDMIPDDDE